MSKMKWKYLKKYYGRLNLRRELLRVFRYMCRNLNLTQQECFLMLLFLFAEVGRWLSPDDIKKVAGDVYRSLLSSGKAYTYTHTTDVSIPLSIGKSTLYENVDEGLEEEEDLSNNKAETRRESQEISEETSNEFIDLNIGNEVVESWLKNLSSILSKLMEEFYLLYIENEELRKKNKELKKTLNDIMDYIMSHDPILYAKILELIGKSGDIRGISRDKVSLR